MKLAFINGRFIPEQEASVSVLDRGYLYGDGLFETLRVYGGRPFLWERHWRRMADGAEFLRMSLPCGEEALLGSALQLIARNEMPDSVLRIHLSRGIGPRGYSIQGTTGTTLIMTLHPAPVAQSKPLEWSLAVASVRLPARDQLARFKTCNKLHQIVARTEAEDRGANDALLLNTDGRVAETTSCNLFWVWNDTVFTPPVESGILPGITRGVMMELCAKLTLPCEEKNIGLDDIKRADGIFLTSSVLEVIEVANVDQQPIARSVLTARLHAAYRELATAGMIA
jgi:aminodeoxychorismate lyase